MGASLRPAVAPIRVRRSLISSLGGERQDEGEDGHRHRASHAVRRDDEGDAGRGAGRDVDVVVADAEPRDDGAAAAVRCYAALIEAGRQQDERVETASRRRA